MKIIITFANQDAQITEGVVEDLTPNSSYTKEQLLNIVHNYLAALGSQMDDFDITQIQKIIITDKLISLVTRQLLQQVIKPALL